MTVFKCKMCGGSLEFENASSVGVCSFCGTKQTLPKNESEANVNLYNRANNLRLKCEFDKALSLYEKIVENDESDAEAHWGIVLCKYGVEYVEDPKTQKRIPTCHRTLFESVTKDLDYQMTIDYSDSDQQALYESEARAIDKIQRETLNIVKNEKPFDIFICYKEKDSNGNRTTDSVLANDIYYNLTNDGFKVFYAAITLEDKLGQEYEPYIFAALSSSKVMLVIGTKPEYFSAVWVRNEWSRFMNLMKTDRTKTLIPCYRDMDPYDLPEEFAHLQAQDMSKIGFINDVARGIKKLLHKDQPQEDARIEKATVSESANVKSLLKRIELFLEDDEVERAEEFSEKALNIDPENAQIYFYKLLIEYKCNTKEDLYDLVNQMSKETSITYGCYTKKEIIAKGLPIFESKNYKKIVRFAKTSEDKSIIDDIDKAIDINWDELKEDDVSNLQLDDFEFIDYDCPNCGEMGSYPKALCRYGAVLHCPFCDKDFKVSNIDFGKDTSSDNKSDNSSRKYTIDENGNKLETYNIFPRSDVSSPLFEMTTAAPDFVYEPMKNSDKYIYTPYIISGKVTAIFSDIYKASDYFGVKARDDESVRYFHSFVIENEIGKMWICDVATVDVNYFASQLSSGEIENDEWCEKFVNEFGGYDKRDYPKIGETVDILGLYMGYNKRFDVPVCYFGINKIYYDWCREE